MQAALPSLLIGPPYLGYQVKGLLECHPTRLVNFLLQTEVIEIQKIQKLYRMWSYDLGPREQIEFSKISSDQSSIRQTMQKSKEWYIIVFF